MIGLDAVLRAVHVAFQLRVAQVAQRVEAADQLVELEDRPSRRVRRGKGAQLADQRALGISFRPSVATIWSMLAFSSTVPQASGLVLMLLFCYYGKRNVIES